MAKIALTDLTTNYGSQTLHNNNNATIEDHLNNKVLYRNNPTGEPNQMENDLDMNSNDLLNVNEVSTGSLRLRGALVSTTAWSEVNGVKHFDTMTNAVANTNLVVGDVLLVEDRDNTHWDVVLSSGVTENSYDIVQCTGVGTLSLVLRLDGGCTSFRALGAVGDGATDTDALLARAEAILSDGSTLFGHPDDDYLISGIQVIEKAIIIDMRGGTISSSALSNSAISFSNANGQVLNATMDNVWIGWSGASVSFGKAYRCRFINQTYSNTTATNNAQGVVIDSCYFTGQALGPLGVASYPCFQITTGAGRSKFTNNYCYDVTSGITSDGISAYSDNLVVSGNTFDTMIYYALKTDVGNFFIFENNKVKNSFYGIFYEAFYTDNVTYGPLSGTQLVVTGNYFDGVTDGCLYCTAATSARIRGVFRDNYMTGCNYGIRRAVGHLVVSGNHFYNGAMFYYYNGGSFSSWDLTIENNVIDTTTDPTALSLGNDTDGTPIVGAIVLGALTSSTYKTSITVRNNTISNYYGNGIMVASLGSQYPLITITDNKFDAGASSTRHMLIGASDSIIIKHNKEITAPASGVEVFFPRIDRNLGFVQYEDNDWQFSTASPTTKTWLRGTIHRHSTPASAGNIGWANVFAFSTTLTATEPNTETSMAVTSGTGTANGDIIGVMLDSGSIHWTTISSGGGTTTIVLTSGITGQATSGNRVYVFRWKSYGVIA